MLPFKKNPFFVIPSKTIPMHWLSLLDVNNTCFLKLKQRRSILKNVKIYERKIF